MATSKLWKWLGRRLALRFLVAWAGNFLGLLAAAALLPAVNYRGGIGTLVLAGLILGLVNLALRPIVIVMTLPAVVLTLGVALLLINALMLWLTSKIVTDLLVGGFWSTVGGAAVIWFVNLAVRHWTGPPLLTRHHGVIAAGRRRR